MSRFHSYLNSATTILKEYSGDEPFGSFLKKYFALHKKFGSSDRRQVSHLCYCFFRLGKLQYGATVEERILAGLFLCSESSNELLKFLRPDWNEQVANSPRDKLKSLRIDKSAQDTVGEVFPWKNELSEGIDHIDFCESFFIQPDVFIRLRPKQEQRAREKLSEAKMAFQEVSDTCLSLPAGSKIESVIDLDREAVVQDLNSQATSELFKVAISKLDNGLINAWDCCAGSGGKSIMLFDLHRQLDLTVSDVRRSIIVNLEKRFERASIKNYRAIVADVASSAPFPISDAKFDLVICDVPCTGSGTWGRTPEQLYYFDDNAIAEYSSRQRKIMANVITHLKPGSFLVYITCSVFKKENEEVVAYIQQNSTLELITTKVLPGYDKRADTMFCALFGTVSHLPSANR